MVLSKMGVIRTSKKEDERRVPIHPGHLKRLPENIRRKQFSLKASFAIHSHVISNNQSMITCRFYPPIIVVF